MVVLDDLQEDEAGGEQPEADQHHDTRDADAQVELRKLAFVVSQLGHG